jgi:hypothetical protein
MLRNTRGIEGNDTKVYENVLRLTGKQMQS